MPRDGQYRALTDWPVVTDSGEPQMFGRIELPLAVGIVVPTKVHPMAKVALKILGVASAPRARRGHGGRRAGPEPVGARVLTAEGIQRGHMALHARQVALAAGASPDQVDQVAAQLIGEGQIRGARESELVAQWSETAGKWPDLPIPTGQIRRFALHLSAKGN